MKPHFSLAPAMLALSAAPALADNGPYVALRGGLSQAQTASYEVGAASAVANGLQERSHIGYEVDVAAGYQLGPLRFEVEGSQKHARPTSLFTASTVTVPNSATNLTSKGAGTFSEPTGKTRTRALMANVIVSTTNRDMFADGNVHFFAGAGAGHAWGRAFNHRAVSGADSYLNGGAKSFAWQLMVGARYDMSSHFALEAAYKYFSATRLRFTDTAGRRLSGAQSWNGFLLGASYAF